MVASPGFGNDAALSDPESTFVCGIIGAAGELGDLDINPLVGLLHHRGPDEHGYVATDNVQFG